MAGDPYKYFRVEARELLDVIGQGVATLERGPVSADLVAKLLRAAHTLKGAARVVKQREMADEAHALEEVLEPYRQGQSAFASEDRKRVVARLDAMEERLSALALPAAPGPTGAVSSVSPARVIRADVAEVDTLLQGLFEVQVHASAMQRVLGSVERIRELAELTSEQMAMPRILAEGPQRRTAISARLTALTDELKTLARPVETLLADALVHIDRELGQARDAAERLRLVPASAVFGSLEMTVRDAAEVLGKRALFEGRGGDVRLDGHVLGAMQPALAQIVRNAVAHGIESESERVASRKPIEGRIVVDVRQTGRTVVFRCSDDGRGVDVEAVRRAALRKGLDVSELGTVGSAELLDMLLSGGLTTAGAVTEISGRGIGLDIVREATAGLRGEVRVHSTPRIGTTLEIRVPLTLAAIDSLVVESGGVAATIPLEGVVESVSLGPDDVSRTPDGDRLVHEGTIIPYAPLVDLMGNAPGPTSISLRPRSAVIVRGREGRAAIGVDKLSDRANALSHPLPALAPSSSLVAGASFDALGNPRIALDPDALVQAAQRLRPALMEATLPTPILVIDDSLTTRMLEQSILESAGYEVDTATSGEEGLSKARARKYALFLVDVEMPGIDGFTFVERVRADAVLRATPAILVTSRMAPEDKQRGIDVGAQGYIVKSQFEQRDLLDRIRKLVG